MSTASNTKAATVNTKTDTPKGGAKSRTTISTTVGKPTISIGGGGFGF
jgi:hypothetical protein